MRLVLDCNVIIAAGLTRGTYAAVVEFAVRGHEVVVSDGVMAEYRAVSKWPKHQRAHQVLKNILDSIGEVALRVSPINETFGLLDPDDEISFKPQSPAAPSLWSPAIESTSRHRDTAAYKFCRRQLSSTAFFEDGAPYSAASA